MDLPGPIHYFLIVLLGSGLILGGLGDVTRSLKKGNPFFQLDWL